MGSEYWDDVGQYRATGKENGTIQGLDIGIMDWDNGKGNGTI